MADQIVAQAEKIQGYFLVRDKRHIQLKIPGEMVDSLFAYCSETGIVLNKNFHTEDHSLELGQAETKLKAKEKLMDDYLHLLKQSKLETIIEVERAMITLRSEIEKVKGNIRYTRHQIRWANFDVYFQLHERPSPNDLVHSPFPWINTLNLSDLQNAF